jgi:hypothetical protein
VPRFTHKYRPSSLIRAGHSGHIDRTTRSHCGDQWKFIEGRVLVHGEDESGRGYMMIEGTDACVHHVSYTSEIEAARNSGKLSANSFIRLRRQTAGGKGTIAINDLGNAERLLQNRNFLRDAARRMAQQRMLLREDGWGGWLGRYQAAVCGAASRTQEFLRAHFQRGLHANSRGR